jgi:hypothetical protein
VLQEFVLACFEPQIAFSSHELRWNEFRIVLKQIWPTTLDRLYPGGHGAPFIKRLHDALDTFRGLRVHYKAH